MGIYGRWGEGKTSVLRFVELQANDRAVPVCWLSLWTAQTQPELWSSIVESLQTLPWPRSRITRAKQWILRALSLTQDLSETNATTKAAYALARLVSKRAEISAGDAKRVLNRIGKNERVVILVDDLDRVDPVLLPKLLMGLHELFGTLEQCAVILALDPDIVGGALGRANPAWGGTGFIEKVVQYPFWLPSPKEAQISRLVRETLESSPSSIPEESILDLWSHLPKNPRRLKEFLRRLQRLEPALSRLDRGEWNALLLVLIELMKVVSAEIAERLLEDPKFLQDLASGTAFLRPDDRDEQTLLPKAMVGRISQAVDSVWPEVAQTRRDSACADIKALAAAIGQLGVLSADEIARHALLDRLPPVLTLREFGSVLSGWRSDRSMRSIAGRLDEHAKRAGVARVEVAHVCFIAAMKKASDYIHVIADAMDGSSEAEATSELSAVHEFARTLLEGFALLSTTNADRVEAFMAVYKHLSLMSNWLDAPKFEELRCAQRELLFTMVPAVNDQADEVLQELKAGEPWRLPPNVVGAEDSRKVRDRLIDMFGGFACDQLLERFTRPGGLAGINFADHPIQIWLLFDPDSPLHGERYRTRLAQLAETGDAWVAENCLAYLRMLAGNPRGKVSNSALLSDASLVRPLWKAACRLRPSVRLESIVAELADQLRASVGNEAEIALPAWVKRDTPKEDRVQDADAGEGS